MAHADFLAAQQAFAQRPLDIVRITILGTSGDNVYYFCSQAVRDVLHRRLGTIDLLPLVRRIGGVTTQIRPSKFVTERGIRTIVFEDDENPEDWSNKIPNKGGTWWTRFSLAYRVGYYGAKVEVIQFYDTPDMDDISKGEVIFRGRILNVSFNADSSVSVEVGDELDLKNIPVPPQISDSNVLATAMGSGDYFFYPTDRVEFTNTEVQWGSYDYIPQVVQIESERIICQRNVALDAILAAQQWIAYSEQVSNALWTKASATALDSADIGPWGPGNATRVTYTNAGAGVGSVSQTTTLLAIAVGGYDYAVWLKRDPDTPDGSQVKIRMQETGGEFIEQTVTLPDDWTRYDVGKVWIAPPGGSVVTIKVDKIGTGSWPFLMAQPNLCYGSTRRFEYCPATTNVGLNSGRGSYGTTAATHAIGVAMKEIVPYRDMTTAADTAAEGIQSIAILRDMVNRAQVETASVDEAAFRSEQSVVPGQLLRRIVEDKRTTNRLVSEVRRDSMSDVWASESGLITVRYAFRPPSPGQTVPVFDEVDDILEGSLSVDDGKDDRITRVNVYWDLKTVGGEPATGDRPEDFNEPVVAYDTGLEGVLLRATRTIDIFSRWLYRESDAKALANRLIRRFGVGPRTIKASITVQRSTEWNVGDVVKMDGRYFIEKDPADPTTVIPSQQFAQVTGRRWGDRGGDDRLTALEGTFGPYRYIGPTGMADYTAQTQSVKDTYGSISDGATLEFSNGDPTHRIF